MTEPIWGARSLAEPLGASVVTVGTFDGVHLGHQALLGRAAGAAKAAGVPPVAYTFDPHPAKVLAPDRAPRVLIPIGERVRLFRELGVDRVVVERFDAAFAEVAADDWVERWLVEPLRPIRVIVGFNFTYGRARGGDGAHLRRMGDRFGFSVEIVPPVEQDGEIVSSTRIRERLLAGDVTGAARLLGRPFALTGRVVPGDGRGRSIGIPTANLEPEAELMPKVGVYRTRVVLEGGAVRDAVTNVGVRPTFGGSKIAVESHILDFGGDLYGQRIRVELWARLRDERRFESPEGLVAQIRADIRAARSAS